MTSVINTGPPPPCPTRFNLVDHVLAQVDAQPEKVALSILHRDHTEDLTYRALDHRVKSMASALKAQKLPDAAFVLMRLGNSLDFPIVFLACIAAGLVPVVTSAQLTVPEITDMACRIGPALILAAPGLSLPDLPRCPVVDPTSLVQAAPLSTLPLRAPDDPAYVVFTSGTSGRPTPVLHAHRAVWARGMMTRGWHDITGDDRILHAGAFNWTYTLGTGLMDPWAVGATALIPAPGTPATTLLTLLADHRATIFAAAPGVYRQMLRAPVPPLPHLRHGLSAGEKMAPSLHAIFESATGKRVHEAFGMSECSTFISGGPDRPAPSGALGYPQPGRRVAILGEDQQPVAFDMPGIIAIGADDPGLMLGYPGAPRETEARYSRDGAWFLTGDTGAMSADGAITYLGRDDDMMNAGGFRVSPLEVESAMSVHPDLLETAAFEARIGPDTSVIALAYCAKTAADKADLARFAAGRLARYKCPRLFIHRPAIPRGANGKILRRQLRLEFEESDGQA